MKIGGYLFALILVLHGCNMAKKSPAPHRGTKGSVNDKLYDIKECQRNLALQKDGDRVEKVIVYKSKRTLEAYDAKGRLILKSKISLGKNADKGPKIKKGDYKTPEGKYFIVQKRCHPKHYKSLLINYPGPKDIARARSFGVDPGGGITIHGQPKWNADGHGDSYTLGHDWTEGCIALPNHKLDRLYAAIKIGTTVILLP